MGKYRFKFSDMIPNAWFYMLKDMSKTRNSQHYKKQQQQQQQQQPHISLPRYSYYFSTEPNKTEKKFYNSRVNPKASDTHFPDPSRKSAKKKYAKRKTIYKPSPRHFSSSSVTVSGGCNCHAIASPTQSPDYYFISSTGNSVDVDFPEPPQSDSEESEKFDVADSWYNSCNSEVTSDIIIDLNNDKECKKEDVFDEISELELPPILTKPAKTTELTKFRTKGSPPLSVKIVKEESTRAQKGQKTARRSSVNSTGIRLRANSPRIASKKIQAYANARKSISSSKNNCLSESFIVVKSSVDPQEDFRDSMLEMILENNIRNAKDLEDLLACYLSLNSKEYHDHIIKAFEQVWFDMTTNLLRI